MSLEEKSLYVDYVRLRNRQATSCQSFGEYKAEQSNLQLEREMIGAMESDK